MAENLEPLTLNGFPDGLNTRFRQTDLPPTALRHAVDIDVLDSGSLARRIGYDDVSGATGGISAWSDPRLSYGLYVSSAGNLVHVDANGTRSNLTTVSAHHRMSYTCYDSKAYFSNGDSMGYVDAGGALKLWGVDPPPAPFVAASGGGNLGIGKYQLAYTVLFNSTEESAPSAVTQIEIASANSKLTVGPVPSAAGIAAFNLYCSALDCGGDGEELYFCAALAPGTASFVLNQQDLDYPLRTLNKARFPACTRIAAFGRWIIGSADNEIWFSEADQASLSDMRHNFFKLEGGQNVVALCPVDDGVYIGTANRLHWLSGRNPGEWPTSVSRPLGVIPMWSAPRLPDDILQGQQPMPGPCSAVVTREAQLCMLRNGGIVQPVTGTRLAMPDADRAEIHYHEADGRRKLIVQLHGTRGVSTWVAPTTAPV